MRSIQRACSSSRGLATMIAPKVSSPSRTGCAAARIRAVRSRRLELEGLDASGVERLLVEEAQRQRLEARGLAREDLDPRVVEAGAGRLLEGRRGEAWRAQALVDARRRLKRVQLGEPFRLSPQLGQRPLARVVLEEADRDGERSRAPRPARRGGRSREAGSAASAARCCLLKHQEARAALGSVETL